MSEWMEYALEDFTEINPRESLPKGSYAKKFPMDVLGEFRRNLNSFEYGEYSGGAKFRNRDTLIARITPCLQNGKTAFVDVLDDDDEIAYGSTEYIVFREKEGISHDLFLYYLSISPLFRQVAIKSMTGSSGRQRVQNDVLKSYTFNLPPLPEQKAIAHILGKLDDKIELNRKMNQTLEEMAQALFKSWFVDFDPVFDNALAAGNEIPEALKAKAEKRLQKFPSLQGGVSRKDSGRGGPLLHKNPELAQLFPSQFTFNETLNKWIPEGWGHGKLGDRYFVKGGFAFKSKDFVAENGIPVVKIKSIKEDKSIDKSDLSMVSTLIAKQREDFWLKTGDILMAMTGATVGKFGVVVKNEEELVVLNQRVAKFYSKTDKLKTIWFVYCFFNDSRNTDFIVNTAQGSAQPNISANEIMSAPMIKPNLSMISKFENTVISSFKKIIQNQKQTETLTQLRDTLLPQLISGKVRVPEAFVEKFVEEMAD